MISPEYGGEIKGQFFNQPITNYVCGTGQDIDNMASQHFAVHDTSMPIRGLISTSGILFIHSVTFNSANNYCLWEA